jgi:hypothetical protein
VEQRSVNSVHIMRSEIKTYTIRSVGRSDPEGEDLRSLDEQELSVRIIHADHRLVELFRYLLQQPNEEPFVVYAIRDLELAHEMLRLSLRSRDGKVERREGEGRGLRRVPDIWYRLTRGRLVGCERMKEGEDGRGGGGELLWSGLRGREMNSKVANVGSKALWW